MTVEGRNHMDRAKIIPHEGKHTLVYARNNEIMTGTVHLLKDEDGEEKVSIQGRRLPLSAVLYMIEAPLYLKL